MTAGITPATNQTGHLPLFMRLLLFATFTTSFVVNILPSVMRLYISLKSYTWSFYSSGKPSLFPLREESSFLDSTIRFGQQP